MRTRAAVPETCPGGTSPGVGLGRHDPGPDPGTCPRVDLALQLPGGRFGGVTTSSRKCDDSGAGAPSGGRLDRQEGGGRLGGKPAVPRQHLEDGDGVRDRHVLEELLRRAGLEGSEEPCERAGVEFPVAGC